MKQLTKLVTDFRKALDDATAAGEFVYDISFRDFPNGCCGDTCDLLGQYLLCHDIETDYICGEWYGEDFEWTTHAWLLTKDGTIIDITGDQFQNDQRFYNFNIPVFVGKSNAFYDLFQERTSRSTVPLHKISCLEPCRLPNLYNAILNYIK